MTATTALDRYAKLEAIGRYVASPSTGAQEVVLGFGARSLIIMGMDDRAIAHWPLASLAVLSEPGAEVLLLAPDPESFERIELEDADMIAAISEVCSALRDPVPALAGRQPSRRWPWFVAILVLMAGAGALLLPSLPTRLVAAVPVERAAELGQRLAPILADRLGDPAPAEACVDPDGGAALGRLAARLGVPGAATQVTVLDHPGPSAFVLPDGQIFLMSGLISMASAPEEVAGILAHQIARSRTKFALRTAMEALDWEARIALVSAGPIDDEARDAVLDALMTARMDPAAATASAEAGLDMLGTAGLPVRPFATLAGDLQAMKAPYAAISPGLENAATARASVDPLANKPFTPALGDRDWLALADICATTVPVGR